MDTAVGLVKAYLELCGYFVLAELPVRALDVQQSSQLQADGQEYLTYRDVTDLDIVAIRLPHRRELVQDQQNPERPLEVFLGMDPALGGSDEEMDVIIGEVKEGEARLNPALLRAETVAFAIRRVGCCPVETVEMEAQSIAQGGERHFTVPGRIQCQVRVVVFAGQGEVGKPGIRTISLAHCVDFITRRLVEAEDVLAGVQFKDPVLSFIALQLKLSRPRNRKRF